MSVVNYFTYKEEGETLTSEDIAYAQSKKHAQEVFENRGVEIKGDIRKMDYKGELINVMNLTEQFGIRSRDKEIWGNLATTQKVKKGKAKKEKNNQEQES